VTTAYAPANREASIAAPAPRAIRLAAPILLPLAPALAIISGLFSVDTGTLSESELTAAVYAAPGRQSVSLWFGFAAALLLPIAAMWASRPTYPRAPRLTTLAAILLVPGYLCLSWLVAGSDAILWYGATHGLDQDLVTEMAWGIHPAFFVALAIFVVGHTLGTVLLGAAAIRSRAIPLWAGVALLVCQPIHFAVGLVDDPAIALGMNLVAYGLNAVAFGLLGWAIFRER
jgi:hypothetical protein